MRKFNLDNILSYANITSKDIISHSVDGNTITIKDKSNNYGFRSSIGYNIASYNMIKITIDKKKIIVKNSCTYYENYRGNGYKQRSTGKICEYSINKVNGTKVLEKVTHNVNMFQEMYVKNSNAEYYLIDNKFKLIDGISNLSKISIDELNNKTIKK